jgi:asparagine synthase (glutamine-hydrolysing)
MNEMQAHRGPDGQGLWTHSQEFVGFAHTRLSIIDLETGQQPMRDPRNNWIAYNGEIYNYLELREDLDDGTFSTRSDTEVILYAYAKWGIDAVSHLRGMFAFVLWDENEQTLVCARDRFGIKPLYYAVTKTESGDVIHVASEAKALLPFLDTVETDLEGLKDYLCFQFCLDGKTLFKGVQELLPGHLLLVRGGRVEVRRYWDVYFNIDFDHTAAYFEDKLSDLLEDSVRLHLRSDVPVGSYISGGTDSSIVAALAASRQDGDFKGFTTWTTRSRVRVLSPSTWSRVSQASTARSSWAAREAMRSSEATRAISSPTSNSASKEPSTGPSTTASSSSPTSRSFRICAHSNPTNRSCRSSGAMACSRPWTSGTSA